MANVPYTPRKTSWQPTWSGLGLGMTDEVDPNLKLTLDPIRRGTTGKIILGHWVVGLEGTLKAALRDVALELIQSLMPWSTSSNGSLYLHPTALNTNLYDLAQELILHPNDMKDQTQDLHLVKAVPIAVVPLKRNGDKDDVYEAEWMFYPDIVQLTGATPKIVYGYVGADAPQ